MTVASNSATSLGLSSDTRKYLLQAVKQRPLGEMSVHQREPQGRFYLRDVVRSTKAKNANVAGIISRCYEEEALDTRPGLFLTGLRRRLKKGEQGVEWFPSKEREILSVKDLQLVDRIFELGSLCKLSDQDGQSGVVVDVKKTLKLQHVFTKEMIEHSVPEADVTKARAISTGDHVVYQDWVGQVDLVLEYLAVAVPGYTHLRKGSDVEGHVQLGKVPDGSLDGALGFSTPRGLQCVEIRQDLVRVNWIAMNQMLSPEEQARRPKPSDIWMDLEKLTLVKRSQDQSHEYGDMVVFRSKKLKKKYGGKTSMHGTANVPAEAMQVVETERKVTVTWQDGTRTQEDAKNLVPYKPYDVHDAWPGDWAWWKPDEKQKVPRVIQSVDLAERTADVREAKTSAAETETVPLLELELHGADYYRVSLHRGDTVLLCAKRCDFDDPFVTAVGDVTTAYDKWGVRDALLSDNDSKKRLETLEILDYKPPKKPSAPTSSLDWYGRVTDLLPDGRCRIVLASGKKVVESPDKLAFMRDAQFHHLYMHTPLGLSLMDSAEKKTPDPAKAETTRKMSTDKAEASKATTPSLKAASKPDTGGPVLDTTASCTQFAILESAPSSHGFYNKVVSNVGPAFRKRMKKELKILQTSLPETIVVRAYEDRIDLLRVLIFGSEGTPYEHAPFLLDFQLKADFPQAPPVAYFHSWSNGHGQVSPNLYEDGNVCLSLLGTWSGHAEENWNPAMSSLLQVFVSIQALVLVREPYYTEPGLEKLKGTPDSQLNSRMYSEKSYILSRGFVRHALDNPIEGLEGEIKTYYFKRGGLSKVVSRARAMIAHSSAAGSSSIPMGGPPASGISDEPLPSLTKGGAIMLGRSVKALEISLKTQSGAEAAAAA